jgi:uncharacterized protein YlxW (UPF0749 family)
MFKVSGRIVILITFMVFGLLISVQFKSTINANKQKENVILDSGELISRIDNEKEIMSRLEAELVNLEKNYETLLESCYKLNTDTSITHIKKELDRVSFRSGMLPVKGAGIVIKLDDAPARKDVDPNLLIIHDQDIRIILNELKKAGAQAISVNSERIIPVSEQVCAGPTIIINDNRYAVPYVINAIGEQDVLYNSIVNCERIGLMIRDKIRVEINKSDEIKIPELSGINLPDKLVLGMEAVKHENQ